MKSSTYLRILVVLFLLTLPFVNPWVRGDGVGYYAYVRSLLVERHLRFENDWRHANPGLRRYSVDGEGRISPDAYTRTGQLDNRYAVGPSLLWAPFLIPVHVIVVGLNRLGVGAPADGFSAPYLVTMALATALYGFLGLCVSYGLAKRYVPAPWAFLATLGIWFASSLPVYMYFDPAYSHAHSFFSVAVFLWYWCQTRSRRTIAQWMVLGLISGVVLDVYYLNVAVLLLPLLESLRGYWIGWRKPERDWKALWSFFLGNLACAGATLAAFLPTMITRQLIYGRPLRFGYEDFGPSHWMHPALWQPLLSSNHGLLTWTPIIIPALVGLALFRRYDRELANYSLAVVVFFYYNVACHPEWHGLSSYGNRFFLSLAPFFVLGLSVMLQEAGRWFTRAQTAWVASRVVIGVLVAWNLAFIFQWGTGLVPHRGPIYWRGMAYNQVVVVPAKLGGAVRSYFCERGAMMQRIEDNDVRRRQEGDRQKER